MTTPVTHLQEGQKLTADGEVDLFEVTLRNSSTTFRFRDGPTVIWQGSTYESMACQMSGDSRSAEGEEARPLLRVMNPLGIFNEAVINGDLDLGLVKRKRVLLQHLEADTNIYIQRMWYVSRCRELISGQSMSFELRSMSEGTNFQIPVRMYMPSEGFPLVTF